MNVSKGQPPQPRSALHPPRGAGALGGGPAGADPASIGWGASAIVAIAIFAAVFVRAESQVLVTGLIIGAVVAIAVAAKAGVIARVGESFAWHERGLDRLTFAACIAVAALFYDQHFALLMFATVLLYFVACIGLNLQFGYTGVVNFAGAAFFGVGAYTAAVLSQHTPIPHLAVIAIAGAVAAAIGSVLIIPVLRTRGHYAAMVTIAFGVLFKTFLEVNDTLGGPQGLKLPGMNVFGIRFNDNISLSDATDISFYMHYVALALLLAAGAYSLSRRIERSWIGLNLDAVRLDETACATFGIDVARWKIVAYTIGNALCGIAGAVYAMMTGFIAPNNFTFGDSLILVSIILLGGVGNPRGLMVAAAVVLLLPEKLQSIQEYRFLLYAVLVMAVLLFRPGGLLPRRLRDYFPKTAR